MTWLSRLLGKSEAPPEAKQTGVYPAGFLNAHWGITDTYWSLANDGYMVNVIAHRCVAEIAEAISSVPWALMQGATELEQHPLLALLERPNPMQGGSELFLEFVAYLQISGNTYLQAVRPDTGREPGQLWTLRPDRVTVLHNGVRMPEGYRYTADGRMIEFPVDPVTGESDVLHYKTFHPVDDWYGYAPMQAGGRAVDQHNAAGEHNASLLQNGARVGGAWIWEEDPGPDQRKQVETLLLDRYQSPRNAGKPMVLGGKGKWQEMALSPKDMDFNEGTLMQARNICAAFGIPHLLIVPGESTFNNRADARLEFWENRIIPLIEAVAASLNNWLTPMFGEGLELVPQVGDVPALSPRRTARYQQTVGAWNAGLMTLDEARADIGLDAVGGADGDSFSMPAAPAQVEQLARPLLIEHKQITADGAVFISEAIDEPELQVRTRALVNDLLREMVATFGVVVVEEIGRAASFQITERVNEWIIQNTASQVTMVNSTTKNRIADAIGRGIDDGLDLDGLTRLVNEAFTSASSGRARVIAQTESTMAAGFGASEAIVQSSVEKKIWITTRDSFARDTHEALDGQIVASDGGQFQSPSGAQATYPGGFGVASEDVGCRCSVAAHFDGTEPEVVGPPIRGHRAMTEAEMTELWERRDALRETEEDKAYAVWRRIFGAQRAAVLTKLREVGS